MRSSVPDLESVINAGVRTLIYDGDAVSPYSIAHCYNEFLIMSGTVQDYIVNFIGVEAMVDALNTHFSALYAQQTFAPYTVVGQTTGEYKNAGTFSYVRIYGAGHEVPAYKVRFFCAVAWMWSDYLIF